MPRAEESGEPRDPGGAPPAPRRSLRRRSIEGAVWQFLGFGGGQGVRFISNLILTRLLVPEYFAVMALVNTVLMGLQLFSDVGIGPNVIQSKRGEDPAFLGTAWSVQVVRGLVLWSLTFVIAWPVAAFYEVPDLRVFLPVAGTTAAIQGLNSMAIPVLRRRVELRPEILVKFIAQVVGTSTMVIWAAIHPTVWALVGGAIVSSLVTAAASYQLAARIQLPRRPGFGFEREALRELVGFGRWIFVSTVFTFFAGQSDRLILGKLFELGFFGVYTLAVNIANLPPQLVKRVFGSVLMPAIAEMKSRPREDMLASLRRVRWKPTLAAMVGLASLSSVADVVVGFLYDDNFREAGWMLSIILVGNAIGIVQASTAPALIALGTPQYTAAGTALRFFYLVAALPLGFHLFGRVGAVVAMTLAEVPVWITVTVGLRRLRLHFLRQDLLLLGAFAAVFAGLLGLRLVLGFGLPWDVRGG